MKTLILMATLTLASSVFAAETWKCKGSKHGITSLTVTGSDEMGFAGQLFDNGAYSSDDYAIKLTASGEKYRNELSGDDGGSHDINSYTVKLVRIQNAEGDVLSGKAVVFISKIVDCVGDFDDVELLKCSISEK